MKLKTSRTARDICSWTTNVDRIFAVLCSREIGNLPRNFIERRRFLFGLKIVFKCFSQMIRKENSCEINLLRAVWLWYVNWIKDLCGNKTSAKIVVRGYLWKMWNIFNCEEKQNHSRTSSKHDFPFRLRYVRKVINPSLIRFATFRQPKII